MRQINVLEGKVVAPEGMKVGIVASRFNEIIVNKLLGGAVDGLVRHGVEDENITAAWVPGAFEIPTAASKMAALRLQVRPVRFLWIPHCRHNHNALYLHGSLLPHRSMY